MEVHSDIRLKATYVGTAMMILEIGDKNPIRIVTDPVLDPPGREYKFAMGAKSKKTLPPALTRDQIGQVDVVLLSHDQHADNLDDAGRKLLPQAGKVITTPDGSRRLKRDLGSKVIGLQPWQKTQITTPEGWVLTVTATPSQHVQWPILLSLVGQTTGFILEWPGQRDGVVYISGDTVFFKGIEEVGKRYSVATAFMHLGSVQFSASGGLRYTFDGKDGVKMARAIRPKKIFPLHFDGWSHFQQNLDESLKAFDQAGLRDLIQILPPGEAVEIQP